MWTFPIVVIVRVIDADTVDVSIDRCWGDITKQRVQLADIDGGNVSSPDPEERTRAMIARNRLRELLKPGTFCVLKVQSINGKYYGRIYHNNTPRSVNQMLLDEGLVRLKE